MRVPYNPRVVDACPASGLKSAGAVLIQGPGSCGKTTTAENVVNSVVKTVDKENPGRAGLAQINPGEVLTGDIPRLIDEWQAALGLRDAVKQTADERRSRACSS